jgi:hypothetical protein
MGQDVPSVASTRPSVTHLARSGLAPVTVVATAVACGVVAMGPNAASNAEVSDTNGAVH